MKKLLICAAIMAAAFVAQAGDAKDGPENGKKSSGQGMSGQCACCSSQTKAQATASCCCGKAGAKTVAKRLQSPKAMSLACR